MKTNRHANERAATEYFGDCTLTTAGGVAALGDAEVAVLGVSNRISWLIPPPFRPFASGAPEVLVSDWYDTGWCVARVKFWTDDRRAAQLRHAARALLRIESGTRTAVVAVVLDREPERHDSRAWVLRAVVVGVVRDDLGLFPSVPFVTLEGFLGEQADRTRLPPEPVVADLGGEEVAPLFVVTGSPGES
jgi:hypothetical protein